MARPGIWIFLLTAAFWHQANTSLLDVWMTCVTKDPKFAVFTTCNASSTEVSVYIKLLQLPVTALKGDFKCIYQSVRPVTLISANWDVCRLFKNPGRNYGFHRLFSIVQDFVNINHSCPYNHDLIVSSAGADRSAIPFAVLPGKYNLSLLIHANGAPRLYIDAGIRLL